MNLFYMNHETQEYIAKHQGAVTIDLEFEPAMGGCCTVTTLKGSYVAKIYLGYPADRDSKFISTQVENIKVFYPEKLAVKEGFPYIEIRLIKKGFIKWLEVMGAQGKVMA